MKIDTLPFAVCFSKSLLACIEKTEHAIPGRTAEKYRMGALTPSFNIDSRSCTRHSIDKVQHRKRIRSTHLLLTRCFHIKVLVCRAKRPQFVFFVCVCVCVFDGESFVYHWKLHTRFCSLVSAFSFSYKFIGGFSLQSLIQR